MENKEKDIPVWFSLLMCGILIYGLKVIISHEGERLKNDKNQEVKEMFSPMSDGEEILNAYKL